MNNKNLILIIIFSLILFIIILITVYFITKSEPFNNQSIQDIQSIQNINNINEPINELDNTTIDKTENTTIINDIINDIIINNKLKNDDNNYSKKFIASNNVMTKLINNNKLPIKNNKKNKILFVTFDNRNNEYIFIHNKNITEYAKKWGYDYKFLNQCDDNVYWCKIKIVLSELQNDNYDYVIWMDSDSSIKKDFIDINDIINLYDSHIFVGSDNIKKLDIINAGIFIIKNSHIGKQFLQDCLDNVDKNCFKKNSNFLNGNWAGPCYEQGQMNIQIADKYSQYTTVLTNEFIRSFGKCIDNSFIMHLYGGSNYSRKQCLSTKYNYQ
jgi:hypothetical protein